MPEVVVLGPERHAECLQVLREGFGTQIEEYGITQQNDPGYPSYWEQDRIAQLVARPMTLLGVVVDGRIEGLCFVGASRNDPLTWSLRHLTVLSDARHNGYGEALVLAAADSARSAGARVVSIGIIAENLRLADWYRRLGFVTTSAGNRYGTLPFTVDHLELTL